MESLNILQRSVVCLVVALSDYIISRYLGGLVVLFSCWNFFCLMCMSTLGSGVDTTLRRPLFGLAALSPRHRRILLEKVADSARKAVKLAEPYKRYGGQFLEFCSISLSTYQTCMKCTRKSTEFCQFFCQHHPPVPTFPPPLTAILCTDVLTYIVLFVGTRTWILYVHPCPFFAGVCNNNNKR